MITQKHGWLNAPLTIESIRILSGANYYSGGKVVLMRLNLGEYDEVMTNRVSGFYEALKALVPSLYEHHCSPGHPGGFFERVQEGTLWGHVAEHIAIELQTLAGMDVSFGKTRQTKDPGVYHVIFRYFTEPCGVLAGQLAVQILNSLLTNQDFDHLPYIAEMKAIRESEETILRWDDLVDTAERLRIPVLWNEKTSTVTFGSGKHSQSIDLKTGLIHEWLLRHLFPEPDKSRIPLIAVSGSEGAVPLIKALYKCLKSPDLRIGITASYGNYLNDDLVEMPLSGRDAVHNLIIDKSLDLAISEITLSAILSEGLPYDYALLGVLLNVKANPAEQIDLDKEEDIAYALSVVAEQVLGKGYAILNADDELVSDMAKRIDSRIIYFSRRANPAMQTKLKTNSRQSVVYLENGHLVYYRMGQKLIFTSLEDLPFYHQHQAENPIQTLLALTAILIALKWQPERIVTSMKALL